MKNHIYNYNSVFQLESGHQLSSLKIAYSTIGQINEAKDNIIWVCHALTANSDPSSWWSELVGEGKYYNPEKYFIICANVIGSCYGSSGPLTEDEKGKPFYNTFPKVTIRDMVKAHEILRNFLGISSIHTCIGGSLGGQQAMEWAILQPHLIQNLVLLCTNAFHSPWGIAFNEAQRMALAADYTFAEPSENAGANGLKAARAIALLSYRNYMTYQTTQKESESDKIDHYKASSYQQYQGEKLEKRFNAHAYYLLTKAMDSHHVGRGRIDTISALNQILSKTLIIGVSSDILFPVDEQKFLAVNIAKSSLVIIDSLYGHDGFLIETEIIQNSLIEFYNS
ncbi:MAG: homoserine O-acetyltransferase [Cytophagales bacterium]|nr:MAG: homoserine O-acetyltransferase [Cytophagales bacterium]